MECKTGRSKAEKKNGQKWVEGNYDAKMKAKAENDDVMPDTPALETSDHPLSREWSSENLPEILFYLTPPPSRFQGETVQYLRDEETGEIVLSEEGHHIKDFEILPRYISIEVEGWMIEAWRRIDTRITYQDILDRQRSDLDFGGIGLKKLTKNALQNHCYRDCRKILNNWVEYGRRDEPHRTEVETIEELTYNQIVYNTVLRESSTFKGRLVKFAFRRQKEDGLFRAVPVQVTPSNVRRTTFDIVHFMDAALPTISPDNHMTPSMDAAWQMSLLLTERARMHGKQHWSKLDRQCLPITWYDRLKASKKTISNPTYDGGCAICSWTEDREEGFAFNKEMQDVLSTPRKRIRAPSDTNSNEPLFKKRKRAQFTRYDLDSDTEIEDEVIIEGGSPRACYDSPTSSRLALKTQLEPPLACRGEEVYDIEIEGYDEGAIQDLLFSGRKSLWSSGGLLDARYQTPLSSTSMFDSPLAKFSTSPYCGLKTGYHPAGVRPADAVFPQPKWEKLGFTDRVSNRPYELPYPDTDEAFGLANYQGGTNRAESPFTSKYVDPSFSCSDLGLQTTETRPSSDFETSDMEVANAKIHHKFTYEPRADYSYQSPPLHPGRMTAQGSRLTNVFSSPPPKIACDFESTPHPYQQGDSTLESSFSKRHSFNGYPHGEFSLTPYGEIVRPDLHWRRDDLDHDDSHLTIQDANQVIEDDYDDYNELPPASVLSTPPESNNMSFMNLLSSDPVMPEQYHHLLDPEMSVGKDRDHVFLGYGTIFHGSSIDQRISRIGRQTPPLLEC